MGKTIVEIEPDQIDITKAKKLRRYGPSDGAIAAKAASLKRVGQLQPIRVVKGKNGKYEAIYGAERVLAARKLNRKVLADVVKRPSAKDAFIAGLIENTDHDQMSPIDKAYAIKTLLDKHKMTRKQVAALFGHETPWLSKTLKLLELSEEQQQRVHAGELSAREAYEFLTEAERRDPPDDDIDLGEAPPDPERKAADRATKKAKAEAKDERHKQRTMGEVRQFFREIVDEDIQYLSDFAVDMIKFLDGRHKSSTFRKKILEFGSIEIS